MTRVTLPHADGVQAGEVVQWWYWSGHLRTGEGRRFGFQQVHFAAQSPVLWGQMAHGALVDLQGRRFRRRCRFLLGAPAQLEGGANGLSASEAGPGTAGPAVRQR